MPLLKPLAFFCTDENLAHGEVLDESLRNLSQYCCLDASVEVKMCKWLLNNGVNVQPYSWSILANLSRSKPREVTATLTRQDFYIIAESRLAQYSANAFDQTKLREFARLGSHRLGEVRQTDVFTKPDRDGTRIRFIPRSMVISRIEDILLSVNQSVDGEQTSLRAIWVMLAFLNCHPFIDGNGRTAKYLFNLVLAKSGISSRYLLPLSTITLGSQGFFPICARRAELQDSFDMILKFIATAIELTKMCLENKPYSRP